MGYFYYSENLNWAAQNLRLGRGLDIVALDNRYLKTSRHIADRPSSRFCHFAVNWRQIWLSDTAPVGSVRANAKSTDFQTLACSFHTLTEFSWSVDTDVLDRSSCSWRKILSEQITVHLFETPQTFLPSILYSMALLGMKINLTKVYCIGFRCDNAIFSLIWPYSLFHWLCFLKWTVVRIGFKHTQKFLRCKSKQSFQYKKILSDRKINQSVNISATMLCLISSSNQEHVFVKWFYRHGNDRLPCGFLIFRT